MKLPAHATLDIVGRVVLLVAAIAVWVIVILLLLETTRQLVDTLRFIVELGSMK